MSETRATQTDGGLEVGLNPRWPPSSKSDHPDKIGYPHLRLPLAINTLIDVRLNPVCDISSHLSQQDLNRIRILIGDQLTIETIPRISLPVPRKIKLTSP